MHDNDHILYKLIQFMFLIISLFTVFSCLFLSNYIQYVGRHYFISNNLISVLVSGLFLLIIFLLIKIIPDSFVRLFDRPLVRCGLIFVLFLLELLFAYSTYFVTAWDPEVVMYNAFSLGQGGELLSYEYFSMYPNNLLLLHIESFIVFILELCGVVNGEAQLFGIIAFQCFLNTLTGYILFLLIKELHSTKTGIIGWIIYYILVGSSGWVLVPYSDSMALIFPMLIVYLYLRKSQLGKTLLLIGVLGIVGGSIKPQVYIVLIAVFTNEIIQLLVNKETVSKYRIRNVVLLLIGVFLGAILVKGLTFNNYSLNKEARLGMPHFLMMGLNESGEYSEDDVIFSSSFDTYSARCNGNIDEVCRRLTKLGPRGYIGLLERKTLSNYNDGTYAFGQEANFISATLPEKIRFSKVFRDAIYGGGRIHSYSELLRQGTWLLVLILSCVAGVIIFQKKDDINELCFVEITLIGVFLFVSIFEARARYIYIYVPVYIILGSSVLNFCMGKSKCK